MSMFQQVQFSPVQQNDFHRKVSARVNAYFKSNNISLHAPHSMWIKTAIMCALYFLPLIALLSGIHTTGYLLFFIMWGLMGIGMTGIGTCIIHDAHHQSLSASKKTNFLMGTLLDVIGAYSLNWKIQHNFLHHSFTNIEGYDEDIEQNMLLRFSPHQKRYWFHKYQHIYAWPLYSLMTLMWMTKKDFIQVVRYHKMGLLKRFNSNLKKSLFHLILIKAFYFFYILVLPVMLTSVPWYAVLSGFITMHLISGFMLACIFQPAHVIDFSTYPQPVKAGADLKIEEAWAIHEMKNTTNFAMNSKLVTWFTGGLNYQIEHHLFPAVCHVHYPKIASIVKETAEECGLPYNSCPTFMNALLTHAKMLKKLGQETKKETELTAKPLG